MVRSFEGAEILEYTMPLKHAQCPAAHAYASRGMDPKAGNVNLATGHPS